jgi:hypothetical protein
MGRLIAHSVNLLPASSAGLELHTIGRISTVLPYPIPQSRLLDLSRLRGWIGTVTDFW